jgi:hypothetical protein
MMTAQIIPLHPQQPLIAGYLRVGHDGHKKLEHMLAAGRLQHKRIVFDAAFISKQVELLRALRANGCEIVLDPNFSEMFFSGKFDTSVTRLPWANHDRPWTLNDFEAARNFDVARAIAEFAVKFEINTVLAPSHVIDATIVDSVEIDYSLCASLRNELDKAGGSNIRMDFQFSLATRTFGERSARAQLFSGLGNLPIDNVWLRIENFGSTSTGVAVRSFIESVRDLHEHNKPVVLDYAGGLTGLSALSFGATGGLCHGIGMKEKFDISSWKTKGDGGGGGRFIYVPDLDKYLKPDQLTKFFDAKGSKPKFGCNDADCCQQLQDMFDRSDEHFLVQRSKQLADLAKITVEKRAEHFLLNHVGHARRMAIASSKLKTDDPKLQKSLLKNKKRLQRFEDALVNLNSTDGAGVSYSRVPVFRGGRNVVNAVLVG